MSRPAMMMRPAVATSALGAQERSPDVGLAGHGTHASVDLRGVQLVGDVPPSTRTRRRLPGLIRRQLQLGHERHEAGLVVRAHAALQRQPRERPVEDAGVEETVAERHGRGGAHGRLAARARAVERHAQPAHGRLAEALSLARSAALRGRTLPGARSSSRSVPMRTRTSRPRGPRRPRTCGAADGASPASARPGTTSAALGAERRRSSRSTSTRVAGAGSPAVASPSSRRTPSSRARQLLVGEGTAEADGVLALDLVARVEQLLRPVAVVGEQEQALGVLVEAAHGVEPGGPRAARAAAGPGRYARRGGRSPCSSPRSACA